MLNILSRTARGVTIEIDQEHDRRGYRYVVFADGKPVDAAATIVRAMRAANAFAGAHVFNPKELHDAY